MPSRGVVPGDVMRASDAWNERVSSAGEGARLDVDTPGVPPVLPDGVGEMLCGDLYEPAEGASVAGDLVYVYTRCEGGTLFDILHSMVGHALSVGVLVERQRWDGAGVSVREAQLEAALREALVMGGHAVTCPAMEHVMLKGECDCGWAPVEGFAASLGVRA